MTSLIDYMPAAATAFAVPQFVPQIVRLARTGDATGVSSGWAALASVNNAAWFAYFALSEDRMALVPAACATILAAVIAVLLECRRGSRRFASRRFASRPLAATGIFAWAVILLGGCLLAGRAGLGTLLTAAFAVQVLPAIRTAYATARPTGISPTTWVLVLCELACWLVYGIRVSDPRLIVLGATGVGASALILNRARNGLGGPKPGAHGITGTSVPSPRPAGHQSPPT